MCVLRSQKRKRCTRCEVVYDDIAANFDIHHTTTAGSVSYTGQCKSCLFHIRSERIQRYKRDISLYCRRLLPAIRCRVKEENTNFNLTLEFLVDLWNKQSGLCYYTRDSMDLTAVTEDKKSPHLEFPSLDRLTPNEGYTQGNVVWCTWGVNRMKNNLSKDQLILFCKKVIEHHG